MILKTMTCGRMLKKYKKSSLEASFFTQSELINRHVIAIYFQKPPKTFSQNLNINNYFK